MREISAKKLSNISSDLLKLIWSSNPVESTILGVRDYDDTFGDCSADAFGDRARKFRQFTFDLAARVDISALDARQSLDYELCVALAEKNAIAMDQERYWEKDPSIYVSNAVWGCMIFMLREFAPLEERVRIMLGRMREIPELLAVARQNICNPARIFVTIAVETVQGGLPFFKEMVPMLAEQFPLLRKELLDANDKALRAVEEFGIWLQTELLPSADGSFALGYDAYQQLIFAEHRMTYTPSDLVRLAQNALEETEREIKRVAARIDPEVCWKDLIERLKYDHPPKEHLLDAYRSAVESARCFVEERDLVTIPDDESLNVTWTPEIERSTLPYAAYFPPAPFGKSKAAGFWVTPVNENASEAEQLSQLHGHCIHSIPVIALHEGYPGHHLQLIKQMDTGSALAKQMNNSLLLEGWALYCEQMMYEQGFYSDPRVRLFQLKDVLWRAVRVIIDVGLHTAGMTFDEAVDILVDKACFERVNAIAEVKRYTQTPTQPMTYLLGKMLILDLKQRMKMQCGREFNLKTFHDQLLSYGSAPPPLIAHYMLTYPAPCTVREPLRRTA
ncbi:MAG TPA: DUF885 domain-containing protein [Armatimonadota bacterium]|jgi:uncharacterized protein (DUF885 family)